MTSAVDASFPVSPCPWKDKRQCPTPSKIHRRYRNAHQLDFDFDVRIHDGRILSHSNFVDDEDGDDGSGDDACDDDYDGGGDDGDDDYDGGDDDDDDDAYDDDVDEMIVMMTMVFMIYMTIAPLSFC